MFIAWSKFAHNSHTVYSIQFTVYSLHDIYTMHPDQNSPVPDLRGRCDIIWTYLLCACLQVTGFLTCLYTEHMYIRTCLGFKRDGSFSLWGHRVFLAKLDMSWRPLRDRFFKAILRKEGYMSYVSRAGRTCGYLGFSLSSLKVGFH